MPKYVDRKPVVLSYILGKVVAALGLKESVASLRNRIVIHPVRNTSLIEVIAFDQSGVEAARIANAIADTYQGQRAADRLGPTRAGASPDKGVLIVDQAVPGLRPVRPNKPFTLFLWVFGGFLLASASGGIGALLVVFRRRFGRPNLAPA